jgi:hypothetical protein
VALPPAQLAPITYDRLNVTLAVRNPLAGAATTAAMISQLG